MPIPDYVTPGNPVQAIWGNDVIDSLHDLEDLIDAVQPIGATIAFPGTTEPTNWMFCRGQTISRTTYSVLFARMGTAFGGGDGSTTFTLPDLRGKAPVGYWPGGTYWATLGTSTPAAGITATYDATIVTHQHGVNIWSSYQDADHAHNGSTAGANARHNHTIAWGEVYHASAAPTDNVNVFSVRIGDGFTIQLEKFDTTLYPSGVDNQDHAHAFNTSGVTANHRHAINGQSDFTGVSGVGKNILPAQAMNFIIRVV